MTTSVVVKPATAWKYGTQVAASSSQRSQRASNASSVASSRRHKVTQPLGSNTSAERSAATAKHGPRLCKVVSAQEAAAHGPCTGRTELALGVPPRRAITLAYAADGHAQLEQAVEVDGAGRHQKATILAQPLVGGSEPAGENRRRASTLAAMLEELRAAGAPKPILTGYLPPYDPRRDPEGRASTILRIRPVERHDGLCSGPPAIRCRARRAAARHLVQARAGALQRPAARQVRRRGRAHGGRYEAIVGVPPGVPSGVPPAR